MEAKGRIPRWQSAGSRLVESKGFSLPISDNKPLRDASIWEHLLARDRLRLQFLRYPSHWPPNTKISAESMVE